DPEKSAVYIYLTKAIETNDAITSNLAINSSLENYTFARSGQNQRAAASSYLVLIILETIILV
ncbi:hypothetical protein CU098_004987, partial [Rhizopus stolonifer]